jgi:tellurite resistance protein TerA
MAIDYTKRPETAAAPVSLSKVTLTKAAPTVSLTKHSPAASGGLLRVNLNWNARPEAPQGRFFKRAQGGTAIDLDLGCLFEFTDGSKGVVQALGNSFEAKPRGASKRVIWLDGDDRSGTNSDGENIFIDMAQAASIKRVLIFAFIYEGVPNWSAADGVVTLFPVGGPEIEVRLDESRPGARSCAIALLDGNNGELSVRREVAYIDGGQRQIDAAYGWGMKWASGHK